VQTEDAQRTTEALTLAGLSSTRVNSTGGFLQQRNVTLLVGIDEAKVADAVRIIRENCRERSHYLTPALPRATPGDFLAAFPVEVQVGGATVFVVPVDAFEKI
jgi:uncharacterized protein YaaQ